MDVIWKLEVGVGVVPFGFGDKKIGKWTDLIWIENVMTKIEPIVWKYQNWAKFKKFSLVLILVCQLKYLDFFYSLLVKIKPCTHKTACADPLARGGFNAEVMQTKRCLFIFFGSSVFFFPLGESELRKWLLDTQPRCFLDLPLRPPRAPSTSSAPFSCRT